MGIKTNWVPRGKEDLQKNDSHHDDVEHGLGIKAISFLDPPEDVNANRLRSNPDKEEICQLQCVVCENGVLKSSNDRDGGVQRIS